MAFWLFCILIHSDALNAEALWRNVVKFQDFWQRKKFVSSDCSWATFAECRCQNLHRAVETSSNYQSDRWIFSMRILKKQLRPLSSIEQRLLICLVNNVCVYRYRALVIALELHCMSSFFLRWFFICIFKDNLNGIFYVKVNVGEFQPSHSKTYYYTCACVSCDRLKICFDQYSYLYDYVVFYFASLFSVWRTIKTNSIYSISHVIWIYEKKAVAGIEPKTTRILNWHFTHSATMLMMINRFNSVLVWYANHAYTTGKQRDRILWMKTVYMVSVYYGFAVLHCL